MTKDEVGATMAPHRVIEDSDEDDGGFVIPEVLSPSMNSNEVGAIPMMQPSSTDPMLFRAVYEEHLGQLLVDDQLPSHRQSPVFEDPIIDQRMSSSVSVPSARKLKRSKTINVSSLSTITEPTLSNRKAKRTESMRGVDNLTQITTPRKSKDTTPKDLWEVPTSSASDKPLNMNVKVISRNAEKNKALKTYGRQLRRTQTVAHTTGSISNNRRLSSPVEDSSPRIVNQNKFVQDQEDDYPHIPKPKRHKIEPFLNVELPETVPKEPLNTIQKEALPASSGSASKCIVPMSVQVGRSASENAENGTSRVTAVPAQDFSSPSLTKQTVPDATVEDSYPVTKFFVAQASRKPQSSIVVVPNTLSDEQKLQYEVVSVASTAQSRQSSLPVMIETVDPNMQHPGDSGTVPNETPLPKLPSGTVGNSAHATVPSLSPPVPAMNRKRKRARSEAGSTQVATSATANSHNKVVKHKERSRTINPREKPPCCEGWVDELSLTSLESVRNTASREASIKTGKNRARGEDDEELMSNDELHAFEESGLEKEQYQPRPSLRRSRSISLHISKDGADHGLPKARAVRKKSSKATVRPSYSAVRDEDLSTETAARSGIIQDDSAMVASLSAKTINEGCTQLTVSLIPESVADSYNTGGQPADVPVVEIMPTVPTQPKKRGRKKTSEIISCKSTSVAKSQPTDAVPATPKENEVQQKALQETDSNKQSLQETGSTPTKASTAAVTGIPAPAQTPTKDWKKGPDQHSPLQSGKVPYRVGLSKKMRIAPLLKIIRK